MKTFIPDYNNLLQSARNIETARTPLYEHIISYEIMEKVLGREFAALISGNKSDVNEFFHNYCEFFKTMGYDTVMYEEIITDIMPGHGSLYGHKEGEIQCRADFERYPWDEIPELYFSQNAIRFDALREHIPEGMMAVGGAGNGIFECVQDIVGYQNLCYIAVDDPELYRDIFRAAGDAAYRIWERLLREYSDMFCVYRFGDDLGFKSTTLLNADDVRTHIIPQYGRIIEMVHSLQKPFIFHSCGCIFNIMDDLIDAGINVKHSNEDQIAPFSEWVLKYGDRMGNFGGIDTDAVCRLDRQEMREYVADIFKLCRGHGGIALGSGNSIPDYVPVEKYINMVEIIREMRKE